MKSHANPFHGLMKLRLQWKLSLAFLMMAPLIAAAGGAGLVFISKISASVDSIAQASAPIVGQATPMPTVPRPDYIPQPEGAVGPVVVERTPARGEELDRISRLHDNLLGVRRCKRLDAEAPAIMESLARFQGEIRRCPVLFAQLDQVWQRRALLALKPDQMRLLEDTHRAFLREGYFANLVLVEDVPFTVKREDVLSKCGWSPFEGTTFRSRIASTWVNGQLVWDGSKLVGEPAGQRMTYDR